MVKVAVFGSGSPLSLLVARRLAERHTLVGVIVPDSSWKERLRGILRHSPVDDLLAIAQAAGSKSAMLSDSQALLRAAEVAVVASFPRRLPVENFPVPAVNVHLSLLPRHRGPDPIFGTYWNDDREAGVTLHRLTASIDAGSVLVQRARPLERGLASRDLYFDLAARAAELVPDAIEMHGPGVPQEESGAVVHSLRDLAAASVPIREWAAERVWHVLSGLGDQRSRLVVDASGQRLPHGRAVGFDATGSAPGRIEETSFGWRLHARDGTVDLLRL